MLQVHDRVVAERKDEMLGPRVGEPEGDLVVVVATPDRVLRPVVERVVHPAHVPLVGEAEAAGVDGLAHPSPGGGLLGDGEHAGVDRSEEHTSELQSLMRISYAVFCLKKKQKTNDMRENEAR